MDQQLKDLIVSAKRRLESSPIDASLVIYTLRDHPSIPWTETLRDLAWTFSSGYISVKEAEWFIGLIESLFHEYRLTGTSRKDEKENAFQSIVESTSAKNAMTEERSNLYGLGHDLILFTRVEVKSGDDWQTIPMMEALELE